MAPQHPPDRPVAQEPAPSYIGIVTGLGSVASVLILLGAGILARPVAGPTPPPEPATAPVVAVAEAEAEPEPEPTPPAPPVRRVLEPDAQAIARAEAERDAARAEQQAAEARASALVAKLQGAQVQLQTVEVKAGQLEATAQAPDARLDRARQLGEIARVERDKVQGELAALARAPKPRRKPLIDKTPVARPTNGNEFHFELQRNRVAYIDLEGLLDRVRTDARLQLRMTSSARPLGGEVGPVGAFRIRYEMAPEGMGLDRDSRGLNVSYALSGWEIVPTGDLRGESLAQAFQPASDFARAINSLDPARHAITLWVYPDSFALYRQLRDALHQRGFVVAARPLPDAMAIRGSPSGSVSAAQ